MQKVTYRDARAGEDAGSRALFGSGLLRRLLPLSSLAAGLLLTMPLHADDEGEDAAGKAASAQTSEPEIDLSPAGAKNAANGKALLRMVREYGEKDDFAGLGEALDALLSEAYPKLEEKYPDGDAPLSAVKGDAAQYALACSRVINMALANNEGVDDEENAKFINWMLRGKGRPCLSLTKAADKAKMPIGDQEVRICMLRYAYDKLGAKASAGIKTLVDPAACAKKLYPKSRKEILSKINQLLDTKPRGCDEEQQEAINRVNVVRYLCSQPPVVSYDKNFAANALTAAKACKRAGHLSHDLGDFTADCNLNYESTKTMSMARTVICYVEDPGDNNREMRGHRAWVLLPGLEKTGFGKIEDFQAMWVKSGHNQPRPSVGYSYPGRGYYPKEYMWGDGWSYYAPAGARLSEGTKVEMWQLPSSPRTAPKGRALSDKNRIPIKATFVHADDSVPAGQSVVFEPDYDKCLKYRGRVIGAYWVRISSGSFEDEYIVELY